MKNYIFIENNQISATIKKKKKCNNQTKLSTLSILNYPYGHPSVSHYVLTIHSAEDGLKVSQLNGRILG